jgi:hypothetical protein
VSEVKARLAAPCALALFLVVSVATSAEASKGFTDPFTVSGQGRSAYGATVDADANGNALAVWLRSDGANVRVQLAQRPAGSALGPPDNVSATGRDATGPQVAMNASGDAIVTWCQRERARMRVYAAVRRAGASFAAPQPVSSAQLDVIDCDDPVAGLPHAAFGPSGEAIAVWTAAPPDGAGSAPPDGAGSAPPASDESDPVPRVQTAELPAGAAVFGEPQFVSPEPWAARNPHVAIDVTGTATVIWRATQPLAYWRIHAVTRPAGGEFGAVQELSSPVSNARLGRIATGADGTTAAVWSRVRNHGDDVELALRAPGGVFGPAVELSRGFASVVKYPDAVHLAGPPRVAVGADGTVIAVWRDTEKAETEEAVRRVFAAVRPPGGQFGVPVALSPPASHNAGAPRVAIDGAGNAIAVWRRRDEYPFRFRIEAAVRPAGGQFGEPTWLSAEGRNAFAPQLALDGRGDAVIVWRRSYGDPWEVQGALYTTMASDTPGTAE